MMVGPCRPEAVRDVMTAWMATREGAVTISAA